MRESGFLSSKLQTLGGYQVQHLSSLDASFLHLETPETPMHVGSLALLELPEGYAGNFYDDVKAMLINRSNISRIFQHKLAPMPFELAEPVWIEDDDVDFDYHIRHVILPKPGTRLQLEALVARLHSSLLDRSRPLWEAYVIEGLEDGKAAYYFKGHHSALDGQSGAELARAIYDLTPEVRVFDTPQRPKRHQYQLGVTEMMEAGLTNAARSYFNLIKALPGAAKGIGALAKEVVTGGDIKGHVKRLAPAPRTLFNASITNQRSYATFTAPIAEIKAIGKRHGGTLNDTVLALCSTAMKSFLDERGGSPKGSLVAAVPVSLREAGDATMNNQVSMMTVSLATDVADVGERLKAIKASSTASKGVLNSVRNAIPTDLPMLGSPWMMGGFASLYGRSGLADRAPPQANVVVSNVPFSPVTLYLAGAKMLSAYAVSIPYHGIALNVTVQSYGEALDFGLTACRRAMPVSEMQSLVKHLSDAFDALKSAPATVEAKTKA